MFDKYSIVKVLGGVQKLSIERVLHARPEVADLVTFEDKWRSFFSAMWRR
jgi:hypothetical protein